MKSITQLEKQKQKLEQALKDKKDKDKLEKEIQDMQQELKGNGKRKEKVKSFGMKIVNGFEAFERFADRHGSDGSELNEFIGDGKKKGKKKVKKGSTKVESIMILILFIIMVWLIW